MGSLQDSTRVGGGSAASSRTVELRFVPFGRTGGRAHGRRAAPTMPTGGATRSVAERLLVWADADIISEGARRSAGPTQN